MWVADLESGRSEPLAPGFPALDYDISPDGRQVVMEAADAAGKPRLWLAPLDRSSPPRQIPNVEGRKPLFGPGGEIFFRHNEGPSGFLYRIHPDGSGLRKALEQPVLSPSRIPPDGRWIEAWAPLPGNKPSAVQMFPLDGGSPVVIGSNTLLHGRAVEILCGSPAAQFPTARLISFRCRRARSCRRYHRMDFIPSRKSPDCPERIGSTPQALPVRLADVYAFDRRTVQRNLYRIPIP